MPSCPWGVINLFSLFLGTVNSGRFIDENIVMVYTIIIIGLLRTLWR